MKNCRRVLVSAILACLMVFFTACDKNPTPTPGGDVSAAYKTEYYLEGDNGYAVDATKGETLSGVVGSTVTIEKKVIDGYYFETDNANNVPRGQVLENGSLVLKAYYSKDYTGRVTFESEFGDEIDMLKGVKKQLDVTVKVGDKIVTEGVTYSSSYKVISIDETGNMEAKMRGKADVTVKYKNVSKIFHVTAYDAFIANEADWWNIYEHLGYWYKFTEDVTLSKSTEKHFEVLNEDGSVKTEGWKVNHTFEGVIDGGGHSLTYTDTRLFHWVTGDSTVIRNITLNAVGNFYWGSTISYGIDGNATIDNVTLNAKVEHPECQRYAGIWIQCGGDEGVIGKGGMFATTENCTIQNCDINLDLKLISDTSHFGGISYSAKSSVIKNCVINCTDSTILPVEFDKGANTITDTVVNLLDIPDVQKTITTEAEFWAIYASKSSLAGSYKLGADITLHVGEEGAKTIGNITASTPEAYKINNNFIGKLDGNSHTLTYNGGRLFHTISGTIENITLNAGKDHYWGSAVAYTVDGGTFKNCIINAEFSRVDTNQYAGGNYIKAPGAGVFGVYVKNANIENCVVNVAFSGPAIAAASYYSGIAHELETSTIKNVTVNSTNAIELFATEKGTNTVTGSTVVVEDGFTVISTEAEWWAIYASETTLAGKYKLGENITLTKTSCDGEEYKTNHTFKGHLNGNGKTLTYTGSRLFYEVNGGTIENITLNAGSGYYWGSAIAFTIKANSVIKNITVNEEFNRVDTNQYVNGQEYKSNGAGGLCVWLENSTIEGCTINITLSGEATSAYYTGIAFNANGATLKNITINCATPLSHYTGGVPALEENVVCNQPA